MEFINHQSNGAKGLRVAASVCIVLGYVAVLFCLTACSSDDEPNNETKMTESVHTLWKSLSGTYSAEFLMWEKPWYTETITFKPYDTPRKLSPLEVYADKAVIAYGVAEIKDTRFSSISGTSYCYYTFDENLSNHATTVTFYEYADDNGSSLNKGDKRYITMLSDGNFYMWPSGMSEKENRHLYQKNE